jgi:hypothetical protein
LYTAGERYQFARDKYEVNQATATITGACGKSATIVPRTAFRSRQGGTVNLIDHGRNESLNLTKHADSYATAATPVISAQI